MSFMIALAVAAVTASGSAASQHEPARWHVEVRDLASDGVPDTIDPASGTIVAAFDLPQGSAPARGGRIEPYLDIDSVHLSRDADGRLHSGEARTLNTGIEIGIEQTGGVPVLHAKDVGLVGFSQHDALGTVIDLPRTSERGFEVSIADVSRPTVVSAYANGESLPSTVRFYVVSRM